MRISLPSTLLLRCLLDKRDLWDSLGLILWHPAILSRFATCAEEDLSEPLASNAASVYDEECVFGYTTHN